MGIDHSTHAPGHGSASISHKFDIRERKFGKRWHVYDHTTNSTVFESVRRGACVRWIENHQDLFHLAATHEWGMKRVCKACGQNLPLSKFRLNGLPGTQKRKYAHWRSKCLQCEYKSDKRRMSLPVEPWWTVFEEI